MPTDTDPFSDESLRTFDEWRRKHAPARGHAGLLRGYLYRGLGLALLYGVASMWGHSGVPEAIVIVAIVAYYCGRLTRRA